MDRHELDFTDSKVFNVNVTQSGKVVSVNIATEKNIVELVFDEHDFTEVKKAIKGCK